MQVHERYRDPVTVWAVFEENRVVPKAFQWGNQKYNVKRLMHVYTTFEGRERVHYFSVADQANFFRLALYGENLKWYLLEHYHE